VTTATVNPLSLLSEVMKKAAMMKTMIKRAIHNPFCVMISPFFDFQLKNYLYYVFSYGAGLFCPVIIPLSSERF